MDNPQEAKSDEQMLTKSRDSGPEEDMQKGQDGRDDDYDHEKKWSDDNDEDNEDDGIGACEDDGEANEGSMTLQLHGIHSGMTRSALKNYISEHTQGLKELEELSVEKDTMPPTKTTTLHFDSVEAAQNAVTFISRCSLASGPDSKIKVEVVNKKRLRPSSDARQQSPIKESSVDKKRKQCQRTRPQRQQDKTQAKTQTSGGVEETQSSVTLEVKNISIKKKEFELLLTELKITSFQRLDWKVPPHKGRVFLLFEKEVDATAAQQILNNCTVGAANKKLVAVLLVGQKQLGRRDSKKSPGATGSSAPFQKRLASSLKYGEPNNYRTASRKLPVAMEEHTTATKQQLHHHKNPDGACCIPPDDCREKPSPVYAHSRTKQQEPKKLRSLMDLPLQPPAKECRGKEGADNDNGGDVSDVRRTSASTKAKSLHVTNIDTRVHTEGFKQFLLDRGIPFQKIEHLISRKQEPYVAIHFSTAKEASKSKCILDNQWIIHGGRKMRAKFAATSISNSQSRDDDAEDRGVPNDGGGPDKALHCPIEGSGRVRRGEGRWRKRLRNDGESDKCSESSEVVSIASRKSFASSTGGGRQHGKTSFLQITNIGGSVNKEEFCFFMESLEVKCQCVEFSHLKKTNMQFAIIQCPDPRKAADAKKVLNNNEWLLGSDFPIKAHFSARKQTETTQRGSTLTAHLDQLGDDNDGRYSNVKKWLEGNKASKNDQSQDCKQNRAQQVRQDVSQRGSSSQGPGFKRNNRGTCRSSQGLNHSGQVKTGQGCSQPEERYTTGDGSNQMTTNSQTDLRRGQHGFDGRGENGHGFHGKHDGQDHQGHAHPGKGHHGQDKCKRSYQEHDVTPGKDPEKHRHKAEKGAKATSLDKSRAADARPDSSKRSSTGKKSRSQGKKQKQSSGNKENDKGKPGDKKGKDSLHTVKGQKRKRDPKEIVITDLPHDITELDIVEIVTKENCQGFINVELIQNRRARTSECFVNFREREQAMEAVLKLYGRLIHGHRIEVRLVVDHEQMEPAIARKTLALFRDNEMPEKVKNIQSAIEGKIEKIKSDVTELEGMLPEKQSFAQIERCESSIDALKHQLDEQQRCLKEFNVACSSVEGAIDCLQVKGVSALINVQKIRHHFERECRRVESPLPVYGYKSEIQKMIRGNNAVVLQGETGSGKSTQIPQYIVDMALQDQHDDDGMTNGGQRWQVVCTQPRRVAALTLAKRVAEEYGCRVGEEVGYFVGNKKSVSDRTVVTFMTDRKLLDMCIADPNLSGYTCVIVDEAHERSVDTDILLATLKKLLKKRQDLHLLIMSATIDIKLFTDYLGGCEELSVPGRTFPVEKYWFGDNAGIGEADYVTKAVQCAARVHKDEGPGDILVFLTSANEIETACRDLAANLGQKSADQNGTALILPLHGRLQFEDQMKVFAETKPGQRKVVFATNIAETSVTINGIKYVIDTGVVKECQYDPKRSMSLLKVTTITRASAQQRAGRAGRTSPGVCYRLYTKEEYREMEEMMKPEILRVHLGMAALQLLELGVEDVQNFDFIQAPDREATRQAMTTLRLLGAVDAEAKLTSLGRKMATLPLEPRLSKMVLEGLERGLAKEAVVLAALISAPGSVFYRGGSDKDKEKADHLKLQFCHESGDIISMLIAYCHWNEQPEKKQKTWCMENSMNSKVLRATKETVKEVSHVLKREHRVDCSYVKMEVPDMAKREELQKVIMSGYFQSLSLYNGHHRAGYTVLHQQKLAHLHPSSTLRALGSNPKWVVYEEFKRTSRDFLFNITEVNITWLEEVAPVFQQEIDLASLQEVAMKELPPIPLGTALMRQITVRRNEKLRVLEEMLGEEDSPCIIEVNRSKKELQLFVGKQCSTCATSVKTFLADERKMIERQQIEVPVGESGVVRQVVVAGAETKFILMAKDYRALEISNMPTDATEDDVEKIVRFAGCSKEEILDVYRFPKQMTVAQGSKWGRVTFISPEAAQEAKEWLDVAAATEETTLTVRAIQGRGFQKPDIRRVNSRVVITWFTWPSKGHAYVNCESTENAVGIRFAITGLRLRGSLLVCTITAKNTRALYIKNVHPHVTKEELEKAIKRSSDIPFVNCTVVRQEPTKPIPTPDEVRRDIYNMFEGAVEQQEMNIDILPVKSEKTMMHKAIVTFSGDNEGQVDARVADIQNNPRVNSAGEIYHAKITASCMLFCRHEIYECLEDEIVRLVETAKTEKEDLVIRVNKSRKTSDWVISIASGNIQDVHIVRRSLLVYVQGETVPLTELYGTEISYQKKTRVLDILQKAIGHLLADLDAHVTVDARRQVVVFFGKDRVRERLKRRFSDYIGIICDSMLREIPLTGSVSPHCTKGRAIRALVKAYKPWLKDLQDKIGTTITLNTRQGVLLIEGDQKVFDQVHEMVYSCLKEAGLEDAISCDAPEESTEGVECGICYTTVEGKDEVYRLSACSHGFHQDCLSEMFKIRLKEASKDYPIECPSDGCGRAMLLCDIRILCPDEEKRLRLYQLALEAHVAQKSDGKLKFCPTADCCMIYKHTDTAQTFVCPECRCRLCSSCGAEPHNGQTCEEFKLSGKNFDDIEKWMKETRADVKKCPVPTCGYMIEKEYGCNHMMCLGCRKHICWVCMRYFSSSGQCYGHLTVSHGSFF